jgi:hypothetical protein
MASLKQQLYKQCLNYIQQRMEAAQLAIDELQESTAEDTKSSAGDKYEPGREMMQQETEVAETGSVVLTSNGNFYISISAGALIVDNERYFAVSPASPIGLQLKGLKKGDEFSLNGKLYHINLVI